VDRSHRRTGPEPLRILPENVTKADKVETGIHRKNGIAGRRPSHLTLDHAPLPRQALDTLVDSPVSDGYTWFLDRPFSYETVTAALPLPMWLVPDWRIEETMGRTS
jgi:hypothetical protein